LSLRGQVVVVVAAAAAILFRFSAAAPARKESSGRSGGGKAGKARMGSRRSPRTQKNSAMHRKESPGAEGGDLGPFGTAPAPDSKRGSGGAVPNGYFFKLILVWSRKIRSRFCEERWDLKKSAPPSLKTAPQPTKYGPPLKV
jgi:hypothetical protein